MHHHHPAGLKRFALLKIENTWKKASIANEKLLNRGAFAPLYRRKHPRRREHGGPVLHNLLYHSETRDYFSDSGFTLYKERVGLLKSPIPLLPGQSLQVPCLARQGPFCGI